MSKAKIREQKKIGEILKQIRELRKSAYMQIGIESIHQKPITPVLCSYVRSLDFHLDDLFTLSRNELIHEEIK